MMLSNQLVEVSHYWPVALSAFAALLVTWLVSLNIPQKRALARLPLANYVPGWLSASKSKAAFRNDGAAIVSAADKKYDGAPFRVLTDNGPMIIIDPAHINEIKNDARLDFDEVTRRLFFPTYPAFEGFVEGTSPNRFVHDAVRIKLTQNLAKMTVGLSKETQQVLDEQWTRDTEWHSFNLRQSILQVVSRLSSLVFMPELVHNKEWLDLQINHTINASVAAKAMRAWPAWLRPFVYHFLPEVAILNAEVKKAKSLLTPVIAARKQTQDQHNDAMQWIEDIAKGRPFNAIGAQLGLGFAAVHTTSDLLTQALIDLAQHPEIIPALRKEIAEVLAADGWEKTTLYKMRLLDSCLKETQRMKPVSSVMMGRIPTETMTLKDGTVLPKGVQVAVSSSRLRDPTAYENPDSWDGARFVKLRDTPGKENMGQLVSTSADHYAFGHGTHACPGRFFAANEVKIALAHIVLAYDFELEEGSRPSVMTYGTELMANPMVSLRVRRRADVLEF